MLLARDRESAFLTMLLTAPLTPADFILAYLLPFLPAALIQIVLIFLVGAVLGISYSLNVALALLILIPMAVACIGLGLLIGSFFTANQVPGPGNVVIFAIAFFGGAWMDLDMLGGFFRTVGYSLSFAHAIDASRDIIAGADLADILPALYWVISYALLFFILGGLPPSAGGPGVRR